MIIKESELRKLIREEILREIQLKNEPSESEFNKEFSNLLDYIGGMEQAFESTAQSTEDGIKRAILQGMYSDFMTLKAKNWRQYINMLDK